MTIPAVMSDGKPKRSHFYPFAGDRCRSRAVVCFISYAFYCVYQQLLDGDDSDHRRQHSCYFSPARSLLQPFTIVLEKQERSMEACTLRGQTVLPRRIAAKGRSTLAYELYALTEEKIAIADGGRLGIDDGM